MSELQTSPMYGAASREVDADDRPYRCCRCHREVTCSELGLYDYEMAELAERGELYCADCKPQGDEDDEG
jgi:hypothetical protein